MKNGKMAKKREFRTFSILALSFAHFVHDVYSSFLAPLLPLLIEKFSLSLAQAGFLSTVMQVPSLLNPFVGVMADRVNLRLLVVFAPAATGILMSLIGVAPGYGVLLIILFGAGISVALFHVPSPVMISGLAGSKKGRGMSFYMTGGELARSLGPIIAVAMVSGFGLEGFYPVMGIGIFVSVLLFFQIRSDAPDPQRPKSSAVQTWRRMKGLFIPIAGILVARGFMHASFTVFLPTLIKIQTGNLWMAGIALTLFEAAGVAGVLTFGPISDTLGRRKTLAICFVGAPAFVFLFVFSKGIIQMLFLLGAGFFLLSTTPVLLALVQENGQKSPAAANGFFMMISFMARSGIVVLVGFAADRIGLVTTYLISAMIGLAGIPIIAALPEKMKKEITTWR